MKQKLILIITLLLALACAAVPAVADSSSSSAPLLPMQFFGTASYENGDAVPAGFSIVAELGGQTFTYTLTEDGIFGSDGVWGEKFLVDGDTAGEIITFSLVDTAGDSISAAETVTYNPGEISEIALTFESQSDDTPKHTTVEVKNTTETFNAKTAAEVSYTLAPENIGTITAPVLAKGGLQLMIDNVVVEKIAGGSSTKVSAEVLANGAVSVSGDISDAESLKVSFIGRMLGDGTGDNNVDLSDAISSLRITAEIDNPTNTEMFYMDVSADSVIDLDDSILLLRYVAELVDENYVNKA